MRYFEYLIRMIILRIPEYDAILCFHSVLPYPAFVVRSVSMTSLTVRE